MFDRDLCSLHDEAVEVVYPHPAHILVPRPRLHRKESSAPLSSGCVLGRLVGAKTHANRLDYGQFHPPFSYDGSLTGTTDRQCPDNPPVLLPRCDCEVGD